jgi:multiple sugar transport system permease protein
MVKKIKRSEGNRKRIRLTEGRLAYLLLVPTFVVLGVLALIPLMMTFGMSLFDVRYLVWGDFAGFSNYFNVFNDPRFMPSITHTLIFVGGSLAMEIPFGLAIALALNRAFRGRGLTRAAILIPWAMPTAVIAKMFLYMYNEEFGVFNAILGADIGWLSDPSIALFSCILLDVWKTTPFVALLLLAGLQVIPEDLYEAARVDGASAWRSFRSITLPLLIPALLVVLVFRALDAFKVYDSVYILTGGGPGISTEVLSTFAYREYISSSDFGTGSAISLVTFLCVFILSLFCVRGMTRQVSY